MEQHEKADVKPSPSSDIEICHGGRDIVLPNDGLKRDLSSRHINMIAIAGMIVRLWPSISKYC